MLVRSKAGGKEALGQRIVEMPENVEREELRDARSGFVAYVPKGSIARGKKLVASGASAFPCASCHGLDLKGDGAVPALAGRSPSGIVRQLYDFKHGTRTGPAADPMKTEVTNMTDDMRLDIAAGGHDGNATGILLGNQKINLAADPTGSGIRTGVGRGALANGDDRDAFTRLHRIRIGVN